jgi:hypothetical protein
MMTDEQYEAIQARIVELENENYASKEAAQSQAWLGEQVVADYLESIQGIKIVEGEVCDTFWLDE